MFSVELVPDDDTAGRIRAQWGQLLAAGLPSQGRHPGASNRPHVTLALAGAAVEDTRHRLLTALAALPTPITVGPLLILGSRRLVLARLVVPTAALLAVQAQVTAALPDGLDPDGTFAPGRWTPHITLARGLTAGQVGQAVEALGRPTAVDGALTGARQWDIEAKREHRLVSPG